MNSSFLSNTRLSIMYVFLGILTATNIPYAFKIGNTYLSYIVLLSFILVVYNSFFPKRLSNLKSVDKSILLFLFIATLSILQVLIYSMEISGLLDKYLKGIVTLGLNVVIYFAVIMRPDQKKAVLRGIIIGFALNVSYGLYQYLGNKNGFPFTNLSNLFPQGDYGNELVYFNYVSGFFLEPAHLLKFFCGSFLVSLIYWKSSYFKTMIFCIALFVLLVSTSSLVVILLGGLILFYVFCNYNKFNLKKLKNQGYQLKIKSVTGILVFWIFLLSISLFLNWETILSNFNIERYLNFIFEGLSISEDSTSSVRASSMFNALSLIAEYPLGAGLNSSATLMLINFPGSTVGGATFNGFITSILELGIIGLFSYFYIFVNSIRQLYVNNNSKYEIALAVALFTAFIATNLEGAIFSELIWVLLGLSTISRREFITA